MAFKMASKMASKMAALAVLLLWVCVTGVTAQCPAACQCGPYMGQPTQTYVNCAGKGLFTIPSGLPSNTRALNLANNQITSIDAGALAGLNLVEIDLSGNNIQEVPSQSLMVKGNCNLEEFEYNKGKHVKFGRWDLLDFTQTTWPCVIDLRKNPISKVKGGAFAGSHNFTVFLGQSSSILTIETLAFEDTQHVIGIHVSTIPKVNLLFASMDGMTNVGWIVFDNTEISFNNQIFSAATTTRPRWFRISNTKIQSLSSDSLILNMDVDGKCDVTANPYRPASVLTSVITSLYKGGVEFINNVMPALQTGLFRKSNIGGMYFHGNQIAGFEQGVFARDATEDICIILFFNNDYNTMTTGLFRDLSVVRLGIRERNLISIEGNAFAGSKSIGYLHIAPNENQNNQEQVFKANAFSGITYTVKVLRISALENMLPKVIFEPFAFDGLNVEYIPLYLYDSMSVLPNDVFTGLTVNQQFTLGNINFNQISQTAFGRNKTGTSIARIEITGNVQIECGCEALLLGQNLKDTVKVLVGGLSTCTATLADGTVSHNQRLDSYNATVCKALPYPDKPDRTNAAYGLQSNLIFVGLITFLFHL